METFADEKLLTPEETDSLLSEFESETVANKPFFEKRVALSPVAKKLVEHLKVKIRSKEEWSECFGGRKFLCFFDSRNLRLTENDARNALPQDIKPAHKEILDDIVRAARESLHGCRDGKCFLSRGYVSGRIATHHAGVEDCQIDTKQLIGDFFPHCLNIVKIEGQPYIVDCTFEQFCDMFPDKTFVGIYGFAGGEPGTYFMDDEKKFGLLCQLLKDGYIPATEENVKAYFDSFLLGNLNEKFYQDHPQASRDTSSISGKEWLEAIESGQGVRQRVENEGKDGVGRFVPVEAHSPSLRL